MKISTFLNTISFAYANAYQMDLPDFTSEAPLSIGCHNSGLSILENMCQFADKALAHINDGGHIGQFNDTNCIVKIDEDSEQSEIKQYLENFVSENCFISGQLRGLDDHLPAFVFEKFRGYGCYCNFDTDSERYMTGHGRPVNGIDRICREVYLNYRCIAEEYDITHCRDANIYVAVTTTGFGGINEACDFFNSFLQNEYNWSDEETNCAIDRCSVDSLLIRRILAKAFDDNHQYEEWPRHIAYGGSFEPSTECRSGDGPSHPDDIVGLDDCCGEYPFKYPLTSNKQCCERNNGFSGSFNPLTHECCEDDMTTNVAGIGTCE